MSFGLTWRHLPSIWSARHASQEAIIANNKAVSAGAPGAILSYTPTTEVKVDSYDIFDFNYTWNINKTLTLRAGVSNLFDVEPAVTGTTKGYPYDPAHDTAWNAANTLGGVCQGAVGCINPTSYSLPNSGAGTTNAGYYDTIGRQYYIGLKARF
jgi:outer membrane receptor for ferrienterochelin and colicin